MHLWYIWLWPRAPADCSNLSYGSGTLSEVSVSAGYVLVDPPLWKDEPQTGDKGTQCS